MAKAVRAAALGAATMIGCSLDSGGLGHASGVGSASVGQSDTASSDGGGATSSSGAGGSSGTSGTGDGDDGSSGATAASESGTDASTATAGESSSGAPPDPCLDNPTITVTLQAADATLTGDVMLAAQLDGTQYVYGETASGGTATFDFSLQCAGDYAVWLRVYDGEPGLDTQIIPGNPADAVRVDVTGLVTDFRYGCQTLGAPFWSWQAVSDNGNACLSNDRVIHSLVAGQHYVELSMLEGGMFSGDGFSPGEVAAVSQIIVTNDLDYEP
ncbi:MAG: hypothetical protein U0168_01905 [Nannocystaceae bacterium]